MTSRGARRSRDWWLTLILAAVAGGCGSSAVTGPQLGPAVGSEDLTLFPSPVLGYAGSLPVGLAAELDRLHAELVKGGASAPVTTEIARILAREPELGPVLVLAAELDRLERRDDEARRRLAGLLEASPGWATPRLVDAAAAEALGAIVDAWARYREVLALGFPSGRIAIEQRAARLEPRATEVLGVRVRDALARSRTEDAIEALFQLERWAPGAEGTLEATVAVAAATGDVGREHEAISALVAFRPESRLLRERLAELALARGDASAAISILLELLDSAPNDSVLLGRLATAKLRFRLGVLPSQVQALAQEPVLRRAGLARLLYWLVPGVRVQAADSAPIATDILDRADRAEIVRVLGWGLIDVQSGIHELGPEKAVRRRELLLATLRAMRIAQTSSCASLLDVNPRPGNDTLCRLAWECGLLDEPDACLPEADVSGPEAVAILGRGLEMR